MKGIDISNNDGTVDFQTVKNEGYDIVYLKATEGLTYDDPMLKEFYHQSKAVGLKVGFYHFLRKNDPAQEAIHFLNCISGLTYDCIHMIDVEHDSLKDGSASWRTKQFADYCKSQGIQTGFYTYTSFLKESMDNDSQGLPLWIAEYGVDSPHIDINYVGFQYSETGTVPGINTNCDLDEFNDGIFIGGSIPSTKSYLGAGDKGDTVKTLQLELLQIGYNLGSYGADGDYGTATKAAVYQFQVDNGLQADGLCGTLTQQKIDDKLKEIKISSTKYSETIPDGVYQIPGTPFYIEPRTDGGMGIHLDRGNYITINKGSVSVTVNDNKGNADSKKIL